MTGSNYTRAFGDQWNRFPRTQLDSFIEISLSAKRIQRCLRSGLDELNGQLVLEAGSGAGRFTEVLLVHGAIVDSFDYSHAVLAYFANNGSNRRLTLVQANLFNMPFRRAEYDAVVCLGVLQHTPDPDRCIRELWERVKPGGILVLIIIVGSYATTLRPHSELLECYIAGIFCEYLSKGNSTRSRLYLILVPFGLAISKIVNNSICPEPNDSNR